VTDRAVLKWLVPVDDRPHKIGGGHVIHVGCQDPLDVDMVTVWTVEQRQGPVPKRAVQVFGTGHPLPFDAEPLGSALALGGRLVWHLFSLTHVSTINERKQVDDAEAQ